jgi:hypothetical protein
MKQIFKIFTLLVLLIPINIFGQVTTSAISGLVKDNKGETVIGATVTAIHLPTGSVYGAITNEDGRYAINNMNPGGPYNVTITYVGFSDASQEGVFLNLGDETKIGFTLSEASTQLEEVVVKVDRQFNNSRTGSETVIDNKTLNAVPTVSRSLGDFTRLTPQAKVDNNGAISIAGQNNRFNSISIDGALNNDVFGLSASGTNGGQTGISPISVDAIESFKVVISPYDVSLSGFTGGGINAITKSGSNKFTGSAYLFTRNQNLAGKTPTDNESIVKTKLSDFNASTYGVRIGGPLIKDKLFFFVNGEIQREERPRSFDVNTYGGSSKGGKLDSLAAFMKQKYNYDPGTYNDNNGQVNSDKVSVRLDYNVSKNHKISASHRYTYGESISPGNSGSQTINFSNTGIYLPSKTNSSSIELKSIFGTKASNSLLFGYTSVRDNRNPLGNNFPSISIIDGSGRINMGSEAFSTANQLDSDVLTFQDKLNYYKGKHNFLLGVDGEMGNFYNLFIRQNFGVYQYANLNDFYNDNPNRYDRSYSLVDEITGDGSAAAANFKANKVGAFISDRFNASEKLTLTLGIRADMNFFPSQPITNTAALEYWNTKAKPVIAQNYDLKGAEAGKMPSGKINISPRIGFNYDVDGQKKLQLRGGTGIFFGRLPMVWPGGVYTNSGALIGGVGLNRPTAGWGANVPRFNADVNKQYNAGFFGQTVNIPNGELNLISSDFKIPSVWRSSFAIDKRFDGGLKLTLEGMYSKNINEVLYENVNLQKPTLKTAGPDSRAIYSPTATNPVRLDFDAVTAGVQNQYNNNVFLMSNSDINGSSYNITGQIEKSFSNYLTTSLSYTYGSSKVLNEVTSSQNSSQWRFMESVNGRNAQTLSYSDFDLGHRIVGFTSFSKNYLKDLGATTVSLFYTGQSGNRYSYVLNQSVVNDWGRTESNDLMYVPASKDQIVFKDAATADAQWTALEKFINEDDYLSTRKGQYAERNGARSPFTNVVDLRLIQDISINVGGKKNTLQFSFDVFNLTNLLNPSWGRQYFVTNDNFRTLRFEGFKSATDLTPTYSFAAPTVTPWAISDGAFNSSRWSGQFGIRYIFN